MKFSFIIFGGILFIIGLLFADESPFLSLCLIIVGFGCFLGGIIWGTISKIEMKKEEKSVVKGRKMSLGSNLELITIGIVLLIFVSFSLPSVWPLEKGYIFLFIMLYFSFFLILFGLARIIISVIKGEEKRWKIFLGWLSLIFGAILFGSATLQSQKTSFLLLIIGIILGITGLTLIYLYIRESNLKGITQIRQVLNNLAGIFLVCGIAGIGIIGYNPPLQKFFHILILIAIAVYIVSLILKPFVRKKSG